MRKFLVAAFAALLCVTVQADDIIVYRHTINVTTTGAGALKRTAITGWTIIDGQTQGLTMIFVDALRKRFTVTAPAYFIEQISAPFGKTQTVFKFADGLFNGLTVKGNDSRVDIWLLNFYTIPLFATVSGNDLYNLGGDDSFFDEYRGSFAYDKANTFTVFNRTMAEKIQHFKNQLFAKGYTEEIILADK